MTNSAAPLSTPKELFETLKKHYWLLLAPAVLATVGATGYALLRQETWKATQTLVVRDEAIGNSARQGRFNTTEAMKSAQETILELARNRAVVTASLLEVGPPPDASDEGDWPSPTVIEKTQAAINVIAPKGAEFGSTEVIRLEVKATSQPRAIAMVNAIRGQVDGRLQDLRNRRAQSILAELQKTVDLAQADLDVATQRLEAMERDIGSDLGELRTLTDKGGGESSLRTSLNQIKNELRQARTVHAANEEKHSLLSAALGDPTQLVATPNQLLESQPALRRLKEGLVDAQLRTAQLAGKLSDDHPLMQAAITSEQEIRQKLHAELEVAVRGLDADQRLSGEQVASLERQLADTERRLDRLAGLRARYANLTQDVNNRNAIVERTRAALSEGEASLSSSQSTSLMTRMDDPETGSKPVGPGTAVIILAGFAGGLAAGVGVVFLVAPPGRPQGRRWSDFLPMGRRATDRTPNRRTEDRLSPPPAAPALTVNVPTYPSVMVVTAASDQNEDRRGGDRRNSGDRRNVAPQLPPLPQPMPTSQPQEIA